MIRARGIQSVRSPLIKCPTISLGLHASSRSRAPSQPAGRSSSSAVSTGGVLSSTGIASSSRKSIFLSLSSEPNHTLPNLHQLLFEVYDDRSISRRFGSARDCRLRPAVFGCASATSVGAADIHSHPRAGGAQRHSDDAHDPAGVRGGHARFYGTAWAELLA